MDLCYLVENENGFERPVRMGTNEELAGELRAGCYTVPKEEWDAQHCPLIPVDFS